MRFLLIICVLTIQATGQVTANFGSRSGGAVIPANLVGANAFSHLDVTSASTLINAGVKVSREFISLNQVWANCPSPCTPSYTSIDGITALAAARGYTLIVSIELTPPDLGATSCTPPTNNTTWATRAAAAIAHVDGLHPGMVLWWEVWNEPDISTQLCPGSGTTLQAYLPIYAAAAPAMIAQISTDGSTALVGGPVLGSPSANAATWLANTSTGLLGNTGTAPSVQFVAYHSYIGTCTVSWTACFNALQAASTGQNAIYASVNTLVRAGTQPSASTTPILVTETNDSAAFSADPVRNDPTFGPLWDAVATINSLNAATVPTQIDYYDASSSGAGNFFCLFGSIAAGDCSQPPLNPYPQFYLYELVNSPNFLNLGVGAHLVASISPGSSTSGLQGAAFYTSNADTILVANPTSSPIATGLITFNNAGLSSPIGISYLLNANNASNTRTFVAPSAISGGFTMPTVNVPANSTMAFTITTAAVVPTAP